MSGNRNGITLFQNGTVFLDDINLDIHDNVNGIGVFDGSRLTVRRSNILLDDNGFLGLNIGQGSTVRLNDNAPSLAVGSTSIQNNGTFGVLITQNSQATLGNATVLGNPVLDILVQDFGIGNSLGASVTGSISCEPGQSSGSLCP